MKGGVKMATLDLGLQAPLMSDSMTLSNNCSLMEIHGAKRRSLCYIQDSRVDAKHECPQCSLLMQNIKGNGTNNADCTKR